MIALAQREVPVGARVCGTFVWRGDAKALRALTVIVGWRTQGRGEIDWRVVRRARRKVEAGAGSAIALRFELEIPAEGPISYEGNLFAVVWEVAVLADIAWGRDPFEAVAFRVVPRRA